MQEPPLAHGAVKTTDLVEPCGGDIKNRFPFLALPGEIRNKIYRMLLVAVNPIRIQAKESPGPDGGTLLVNYNTPDLALLTIQGCYRSGPCEGLAIGTGMMSASRATYNEATTILYGMNTFSFRGQDCWLDLHYFRTRLTKRSRHLIRRINTQFPEIQREGFLGVTRQGFESGCQLGLRSLDTFPHLGRLALNLCEDIMTSDIRFLLDLKDACREGPRIIINVCYATFHHGDGKKVDRNVRISSDALRQMKDWGWKVKGNWELVDQHHRLRGERDWRATLTRNRQNGIECGCVRLRASDSLDLTLFDEPRRLQSLGS